MATRAVRGFGFVGSVRASFSTSPSRISWCFRLSVLRRVESSPSVVNISFAWAS
jgi:hypothetical protein